MILASIEGAVGAAVITLLMLAFRWFSDRFGKKRGDTNVEERSEPRSAEALGAKGDSEEERMRRFLEALGIPADAPEGKRPATPPPLRPVQRREEPPKKPVKPLPPIMGEPWPRPQKQQPPPLVKRPVPKPARPIEPPPLVEVAVPRVPVREMDLPEGAGFRTVPTGEPHPQHEVAGGALVGAGTGLARPAGGELWREALRSPEGLRSAFILREVLGPPPGLQRSGNLHSFPSL